MTNSVLLEKRINVSGKKKKYLAERCNLTPQGLYNCINNKSEFRASQILILCEELGIRDLEEKEAIFFAPIGA